MKNDGAPVMKSGCTAFRTSYSPILFADNPRVFTDLFSRKASARLHASRSSTSVGRERKKQFGLFRVTLGERKDYIRASESK